MPSSSSDLADLALDLAWSLWAELGVSGWSRRHSWQAIDLEPLILFTAYLGEHDARLRDESLDWCVQNSRFVSAVRLRNLLPIFERAAEPFGRYAAAVRLHTHAPWPSSEQPVPFRRTGRSTEPDLSRPALIQLRLRALMGVSGRAEVLRLLLAKPSHVQAASEIAAEAGYGKGNVAATLDMLVKSGVVELRKSRNQLQYRLARQHELVALLGGAPPVFPDWTAMYRVLIELLATRDMGEPGSMARAAEIRRLLRSLDPDLRRLGQADTAPKATGTALNEDFDRWALQLVRTWSSSSDDTSDAEYTVHRLSGGDWLLTVTDADGGPTNVSVSEQGEPHREEVVAEAVVVDDSNGAPRIAHAMFVDSARRTGQEIGPFYGFDPTNQQVARAFAEERIWPMRPGQSATLSADFLRRWRLDRQQRLQPAADGLKNAPDR
jgi:DNA-binding transcriptional ArsR family regulator